MKRVIEGLLYDTDTATLIFTDDNSRRRYYMTPNKRFFVFYITGEMSVKTEDDIKELLGTQNYDKYVEIFGEPQEA